MYKRRTFGFISLFLAIFAFEFASTIQSDSYTIGIQRYRSESSPKSSKWSKNIQNSDMCGGIFREKQVMIRSPNYPNAYPKNVHCEYTFYSPFVCNNEFHIQFLDFQLEPSLSCSKDKVMIGPNEALCGQVIGIMKYSANNGTLVITFNTDQTIENKGFRLIVTRLPCLVTSNNNEFSTDSLPTAPLPIESFSKSAIPEQRKSDVTQSQTVNAISKPNFENVPETSIVKSTCFNPKSIATNNVHQNSVPPVVPSLSALPSCCMNVFNQQKFYLISPGFPNPLQFPNDCLYFVERFHPNVCRLRIEFNYFLLDDWQQSQCTHNFLEIDGQRFCGCKTGFTHYTQWGQSPKSIRFVSGRQNRGIQGFVLEIIQEECPRRSIESLPFQQLNQLPRKNYQLFQSNDPRRCSFNYISWLNTNTNQNMLAKSVCIRNYG